MRAILLAIVILSSALAGCGEMNADWRSRANSGIEKYRKRDLQVTVVDRQGKPIKGAEVRIEQTKKAFPFGSAISGRFLTSARWQEEFKKHFNWAVLENESKWTSNEPRQGTINYRQADNLIRWCQDNGIKMRGHCLFWEHTGDAQAWPLWMNNLNGEPFKAALEKRISDAMTHFKGKFECWDVDNEMLHGTFFVDRAGRDVHAWMYKRARELDPGVKLFVNEFNVLSVDKNFQETQTDAYVAQVRDLISQGAPVDAVGIQGHIWKEDVLAHPEVIGERLDKVASLKLPIWITEFDVADSDDRMRADKLELVYRTAYGHPAVHGIMMWIFWAGNSWRGPSAALFNQDWTINEEGKRFESLMNEWATQESGRADGRGALTRRAFYGDYRITAAMDGKQVTKDFTLEEGPGKATCTIDLP